MRNESWVEMYRPKSVSECVLRESIDSKSKAIISKNKSHNLLITGSSGCGKSCFIKALINDLDLEDYWWKSRTTKDIINKSYLKFLTANSQNNKSKVVVLDRFDHSTKAVQEDITELIDQNNENITWFIIVNDKKKIDEAIFSRTAEIDFNIPDEEKEDMHQKYISRFKYILEKEDVLYVEDNLLQYVDHFFPEFRKMVNELQNSVDVDNNLMPI